MEYKINIEEKEENELIEKIIKDTKCKDFNTFFRQFLEAFGNTYLDWWNNRGWYITTMTPTSPTSPNSSFSFEKNKNKESYSNESNDINIPKVEYKEYKSDNSEELDETTPLEDLI
ncbi:hypothetical protein V6O07_02840 [Arthrospira platensis SPKY2]